MKQSVTSAKTSINKSKLPAIFNRMPDDVRECTVFDYGCGKYVTLPAVWALDRDCDYLPFDPYNREAIDNYTSIITARSRRGMGHRIAVICSNVLNVIDSDDSIREAVREMMSIGSEIYVTVYEGDGTGAGRYTGPDQYQRNAKLRDYARFFPGCRISNGMIIWGRE